MMYRQLRLNKALCLGFRACAGLLVLAGCAGLSKNSNGLKSAQDFNGVWQREIPWDVKPDYVGALNADGMAKYKVLDLSKNPLLKCLPPGPIQLTLLWPMPFQVVQTPSRIAFMFEGYSSFRIIYMDEKSHPEDIGDYPEWMGHSIGHFEGNTLVIDTVGIDSRAWFGIYGPRPSDKLHFVERFEKQSDNSIKYSAVIEDPVYFKHPVNGGVTFTRRKTRIMSYSCEENEKDKGNEISAHVGDDLGDPRVGLYKMKPDSKSDSKPKSKSK